MKRNYSTKERLAALVLSWIMVLQIFAPNLALARGTQASPRPKTSQTLIETGEPGAKDPKAQPVFDLVPRTPGPNRIQVRLTSRAPRAYLVLDQAWTLTDPADDRQETDPAQAQIQDMPWTPAWQEAAPAYTQAHRLLVLTAPRAEARAEAPWTLDLDLQVQAKEEEAPAPTAGPLLQVRTTNPLDLIKDPAQPPAQAALLADLAKLGDQDLSLNLEATDQARTYRLVTQAAPAQQPGPEAAAQPAQPAEEEAALLVTVDPDRPETQAAEKPQAKATAEPTDQAEVDQAGKEEAKAPVIEEATKQARENEKIEKETSKKEKTEKDLADPTLPAQQAGDPAPKSSPLKEALDQIQAANLAPLGITSPLVQDAEETDGLEIGEDFRPEVRMLRANSANTIYDRTTDPNQTTVGSNYGFYMADVTDFKYHSHSDATYGISAKMILGLNFPQGIKANETFTLQLPKEFRLDYPLNSPKPVIRIVNRANRTQVLANIYYKGGTPESPYNGEPDLLDTKHYLEAVVTPAGQEVFRTKSFKGTFTYGNTLTSNGFSYEVNPNKRSDTVDGSGQPGLEFDTGVEVELSHWTSDYPTHPTKRKTITKNLEFISSYKNQRTILKDQSTLKYSNKDGKTGHEATISTLESQGTVFEPFHFVAYYQGGVTKAILGATFNGDRKQINSATITRTTLGLVERVTDSKIYEVSESDLQTGSARVLGSLSQGHTGGHVSGTRTFAPIGVGNGKKTLYIKSYVDLQEKAQGSDNKQIMRFNISGTSEGGQSLTSNITRLQLRDTATAFINPDVSVNVVKVVEYDKDGDGVKERYAINKNPAIFNLYANPTSSRPLKTGIKTDDKGLLALSGLEKNKVYMLVETKAPTGFKFGSGQTIYFRVNNDDSISYGSNHKNLNQRVKNNEGYIPVVNDLQNTPNRLVLTKVEKGSKKRLPGARFAILNLDTGDRIEKLTNAQGQIVLNFGDLKAGHYRIKEIKAPDGYTIIQDDYQKEFWVDQDGSYTTDNPRPAARSAAFTTEPRSREDQASSPSTSLDLEPYSNLEEIGRKVDRKGQLETPRGSGEKSQEAAKEKGLFQRLLDQLSFFSFSTVAHAAAGRDLPFEEDSPSYTIPANNPKTDGVKAQTIKTTAPEIIEGEFPSFKQVIYLNPNKQNSNTQGSETVFTYYKDGEANNSAILNQHISAKIYRVESWGGVPDNPINFKGTERGVTDVTNSFTNKGFYPKPENGLDSYQINFGSIFDRDNSTYVVVMEGHVDNTDNPVKTKTTLFNEKGAVKFPVIVLPGAGGVSTTSIDRGKARLLLVKTNTIGAYLDDPEFEITNLRTGEKILHNNANLTEWFPAPYHRKGARLFSLKAGYYRIKETKAPTDSDHPNVTFELPSETWEVLIEDKDSDGHFEYTIKTPSPYLTQYPPVPNIIEIANRPVRQAGNLKINLFEQDGSTPLNGGAFALYKNGVKIADLTNTGNIHQLPIGVDMELGEYELRQTQVPQGYSNAEAKWQVYIGVNEKTGRMISYLGGSYNYISRKGQEINTYDVFNEKASESNLLLPPPFGEVPTSAKTDVNFEIANTKDKGRFKLQKTDGNNEPLLGAVFELQGQGQVSNYRKEIRLTTVAELVIDNLEVGRYTLRETSAPAGYAKSDKTWTINVVDEGGRIVTKISENGTELPPTEGSINVLTVKNPKDIAGEFVINKVDDSQPAQALAGVVFTLYSDYGLNSIVGSQTTGTDGKAKFEGLKQGTYYLKETKGKDGYQKVDTIWKVVVDAQGQVTITEDTGGTANRPRSANSGPDLPSVLASMARRGPLSTLGLPQPSGQPLELGPRRPAELTLAAAGAAPVMLNRNASPPTENASASINKTASEKAIGEYEVKLTVRAKGTPPTEAENKDTNLIILLENSQNMSGFRQNQPNNAIDALKQFLVNIKTENPNVKVGIINYSNGNRNIIPKNDSAALVSLDQAKTELNSTMRTTGNNIDGIRQALQKADRLLKNSNNRQTTNNIVVNIAYSYTGYFAQQNTKRDLESLLQTSTKFYQISSNSNMNYYENLKNELTNKDKYEIFGVRNDNPNFGNLNTAVLPNIKRANLLKEEVAGTSNGLVNASINDSYDSSKYDLVGNVNINIDGRTSTSQSTKTQNFNLGAGKTATMTYRLRLKNNFHDGNNHYVSSGNSILSQNGTALLDFPNPQVEAPITVKAQVNWNPATSNKIPARVNLRLNGANAQQVNARNNWTASWYGQRKNETYTVTQDLNDRNWNNGNPISANLANSNISYTITNTEKITNTKTTVSAKLTLAPGLTLPANVTVSLSATADGQSVNLGRNDITQAVTGANQVISWKDLPTETNTGAAISYDVTLSDLGDQSLKVTKTQSGNVFNFTLSKITELTVVNKKSSGKFEIDKVDNDGKPLNGATFTLTNQADANDVITKVSGQDGKIVFDNLKAGTYTLEETGAPAGYIKSEKTWTVVVDAKGKTTITGENVQSAIPEKIGIAYKGQKAGLYDGWNREVRSLTTELNQGQSERDFTVKLRVGAGISDIPDALVYFKLNSNFEMTSPYVNKTWDDWHYFYKQYMARGTAQEYSFNIRLKEGVTPTEETPIFSDLRLYPNYRMNNASFDNFGIIIPKIKVLPGQTLDAPILTVTNHPLGKFELVKKNKAGDLLQGATFKLIKDDGSEIGTKTTDTNGKILFENLEPGSYRLVETQAPEGYEPSDHTWSIHVAEDGSVTIKKFKFEENSPGTLKIKNTTSSYGNFPAGKLDVEVKWIDDGTSPRENVSVKLDGTFNSGGKDHKLDQNFKQTYGMSQVLNFGTQNGTKSWQKLLRAVSPGGTTSAQIDYKVEVNPNLQDWKVRYDYPEGEDKVIITIFKANTENVPPTGESNSFEIINNYKKIEVEFKKVKKVLDTNQASPDPYTYPVLAGAEFKIEQLIDETKKTWEQVGELVTSDAEGRVKFANLSPNEYYRIIETRVPEGIESPTGPVKVFKLELGGQTTPYEIDKEGKLIKLSTDKVIEPYKNIINLPLGEIPININKIGDDGKTGLDGVKFRLTSALQGFEPREGVTKDGGKLTFDKVPNGQYFLQEIAAPAGYIVDESIKTIIIGGKYKTPENPIDPKNVGDQISITETEFMMPKTPAFPDYVSQADRIKSSRPNTILPKFAQSFQIKNTLQIDETNGKIKPGDYFYIDYSNNIDPTGAQPYKNAQLNIIGGAGVIAEGEFQIREKDGKTIRSIKYTFTDYVENIRPGQAITYNPFFIDRKVIKEDTDGVVVTQTLGNSTKSKTMNVVYTPRTKLNSFTYEYGGYWSYGYYYYSEGSTRSNIHTLFNRLDPKEGTYTYYVYVNKFMESYQRDGIVTITKWENSSHLNLGDGNNYQIKVYGPITDKAKMPDSFGLDKTSLPVMPASAYSVSRSSQNDQVEISIPDLDGKGYVVELTGKYDGTSTQGLRLQANLKHKIVRNGDTIEGFYSPWSYNESIPYSSNSSADGKVTVNLTNHKNEIEFTKVDGSSSEETKPVNQGEESVPLRANKNPLAGAEFELRKDDGAGKFNTVKDSERTTLEDGKFGWKGLGQGKYQVWETKAPKGFILRGHVASFEVDAQGNIINITDKEGKDLAGNMTIENFKAEYPMTGGPGTLAFTLAGTGLMALAYWAMKKRQRAWGGGI